MLYNLFSERGHSARKVTPEQMRGAKFERWFEILLQDNGYHFVRRNIVYHRSRYQFRQVDVEFKELHWNPLAIVELKYLSKGEVSLQLRRIPSKAGQRKEILTLLDEVEERREFVNARKAVIATNRYFAGNIHQEVSRYPKIELYERPDLENMEKCRRRPMFSLTTYGTLEGKIESTAFCMEYLTPRKVCL